MDESAGNWMDLGGGEGLRQAEGGRGPVIITGNQWTGGRMMREDGREIPRREAGLGNQISGTEREDFKRLASLEPVDMEGHGMLRPRTLRSQTRLLLIGIHSPSLVAKEKTFMTP